jgi:hypothetical protein
MVIGVKIKLQIQLYYRSKIIHVCQILVLIMVYARSLKVVKLRIAFVCVSLRNTICIFLDEYSKAFMFDTIT